MLRPVPLVAGILIILGSGLVHGLWTDRWGVADEPAMAAARLDAVPLHFGDWESGPLPLDSQSVAMGKIAGYMHRSFVNARTGQTLSGLVVCGRPGPIAQHTPDVCYGGEGFEVVGEKTRLRVPLDGPESAEFWVGHFRRVDAGVPVHLRIFWSWNAGGAWTAPETPRLEFARYPVLYKLYLVHPLPRGDEPLEEDPTREFIKVLLPELQKALLKDEG